MEKSHQGKTMKMKQSSLQDHHQLVVTLLEYFAFLLDFKRFSFPHKFN